MFANDMGIVNGSFQIEVRGFIYPIVIEEKRVVATMVPPETIEWGLVIDMNEQRLVIDFLNTGVPHAVVFVDDVASVNLSELGRAIRYHRRFAPHGTNVDVVALSVDRVIEIRTYERGIEGETLACGTGSMAAAIAASKKYDLSCPLTVRTRSGECLEFDLSKKNEALQKVTMKGPATHIYSGIVELRERLKS